MQLFVKISDFQRVGLDIQRACVSLVRGSIEYPRPFWFFLGQCQKEQGSNTYKLN